VFPTDSFVDAACDSGCVSSDAADEGTDSAIDAGDGSAADGSDAGDAFTGTWCSHYTLVSPFGVCTDWDLSSSTAPSPWTAYLADGGWLAVDDAMASSPPSSLQILSRPLDGGYDQTYANLGNFFQGVASHVRVAFDVYIDNDLTGEVRIVVIHTDFASGSPYIVLDWAGTQEMLIEQVVFAADGGTIVAFSQNASVPKRQRWTRIQLDMTLTGSKPLSLAYSDPDGAAASNQIQWNLDASVFDAWAPGKPRVAVGGTALIGTAAAGYNIHIDNLVVDFPDGG
jgi:hypothetical protein